MALEIDGKKCIGCGICVSKCPVGALELDGGIAKVDPEKCTRCGKCLKYCPVSAISLDGYVPDGDSGKGKISFTKGEFSEVWIFAERKDGKPAAVSYELLGKGRELADTLGVKLAAVYLGSVDEPVVSDLFEYGADKVYTVPSEVLDVYRTEPYSAALTLLIKKYRPEIFLLGATVLGRSLAGHVSAMAGTGLTADCTVLEIEEETGLLLQTRPAFGGNVMATIVCEKHKPQMATVRPKVLPMPERQEGRRGETIEEKFLMPESKVAVKIVDSIAEEGVGSWFDKADIIVAAGRGIGSEENLGILKDFAAVVNGTIAASRPVIEAGWLPVCCQVGQTGTTVRPKVYFAIGISGAVQHLVGMQTSDTIVAVNIDPEAPVFKAADYGIVGDFREVLPRLGEALKEKISG